MARTKPTLSHSHAEWHRIAMHVLAMRDANGYARQIASRCLRNCLPKQHSAVLGVSVASIEHVRSGGRPERDHVLPLKMATTLMHSRMSQKDWRDMVERFSGVCLVTRDENMRLTRIPYAEDWRARYAQANIEIVPPGDYSLRIAAGLGEKVAEILRTMQ
jgi:hypothetical protein